MLTSARFIQTGRSMHDSHTAPSAKFFSYNLGKEIVFVVKMLFYKLFYCLCVLCIQILKEISLLGGYRIFESFFNFNLWNIFFIMYKLITKNDNICLFQALLTDAVAVRVILPDILADYERKCPLCSSSQNAWRISRRGWIFKLVLKLKDIKFSVFIIITIFIIKTLPS